MSTYTEEEVTSYIDQLAIDYGTDDLNQHAAITHLLDDKVASAIRSYTHHVCKEEAVAEATENLIALWETSAP